MSRTVTDKRPETVQRPYALHFPATGNSYPLTSEDAQRLIDSYPVLSGSDAHRVYLRADDGQVCQVFPATLGGIAFNYTRREA